MEITLFCLAEYRVYLNNKDEVLSYELDDDKIREAYHMPPKASPPLGATKVLNIKSVWSKVKYSRELKVGEKYVVTSYELNETKRAVEDQISRNLHKASLLAADETETCHGFTPISAQYAKLSYDCTLCQNRSRCNGKEVLCG